MTSLFFRWERRRLAGSGMLLLLSQSMAGCFPMPHSDRLFPAVEGRVEKAGLPVAGAEIFATSSPDGASCDGAERVGATDDQGDFSIEPEDDFKLFLVFGDPLFSWLVCIEHEGERYLGWVDRSIGYAPKSVRLDCDLEDPMREEGDGEGLCRWKETSD